MLKLLVLSAVVTLAWAQSNMTDVVVPQANATSPMINSTDTNVTSTLAPSSMNVSTTATPSSASTLGVLSSGATALCIITLWVSS